MTRLGILLTCCALIPACRDAPVSAAPCSMALAAPESIDVSEVMVSDEPACPAEALKLEFLVTIGGDEPGALSSPPHEVRQDSRGRFYLLGSNSGSEVPVVYLPNGRFLTALGRLGDGPGEFRMPAALLIGPGDTIVVLDFSSRRMTVLSPDYAVARVVNFTHRPEMGGEIAVLLEDGRLATNLDTRGLNRESVGSALQLLNRDGSVAHEFDEAGMTAQQGIGGFRRMRTLGPAHQGFWSGTLLFQYRVELWDTTGRRLARLDRQPPWFSPYDTLLTRTPDQPPNSALVSVREDSERRLWTVSLVADSQWVEGLSRQPVGGEGGTRYYRTEDPEMALDSYLEIIDPMSGRLLLSRRFDGLFKYLVNDSLIGRQMWDSEGIPSVGIYRVTLPAN